MSIICPAQAVRPSQQVEPNGAAESAESVQSLQPAQSAPLSEPAEDAGRAKRKRKAPVLDEYENKALLFLNEQKSIRSRKKGKECTPYPRSRALQVIRGLRTGGTQPLVEGQAQWTSGVPLISSQETFSASRNGSSALGLLISMHERAEISKFRGEIVTRFTTLLLHHEYERIQSCCEGQVIAEKIFSDSTGRSMKDSTQRLTNAQAWLRLMEIFGSGALLVLDAALNSV